eukprot:TRINITY_DN35608_c0_g1_i1.p1 TRINITY_DN35608_c0_g1~~TRINITY_DN35608_c0_g1_i1.p1  ORF type:complete len:394 (+),score=67.59 TRINITY_DN35608_c0_g1_i1:125-1306(+)
MAPRSQHSPLPERRKGGLPPQAASVELSEPSQDWVPLTIIATGKPAESKQGPQRRTHSAGFTRRPAGGRSPAGRGAVRSWGKAGERRPASAPDAAPVGAWQRFQDDGRRPNSAAACKDKTPVRADLHEAIELGAAMQRMAARRGQGQDVCPLASEFAVAWWRGRRLPTDEAAGDKMGGGSRSPGRSRWKGKVDPQRPGSAVSSRKRRPVASLAKANKPPCPQARVFLPTSSASTGDDVEVDSADEGEPDAKAKEAEKDKKSETKVDDSAAQGGEAEEGEEGKDAPAEAVVEAWGDSPTVSASVPRIRKDNSAALGNLYENRLKSLQAPRYDRWYRAKLCLKTADHVLTTTPSIPRVTLHGVSYDDPYWLDGKGNIDVAPKRVAEVASKTVAFA